MSMEGVAPTCCSRRFAFSVTSPALSISSGSNASSRATARATPGTALSPPGDLCCASPFSALRLTVVLNRMGRLAGGGAELMFRDTLRPTRGLTTPPSPLSAASTPKEAEARMGRFPPSLSSTLLAAACSEMLLKSRSFSWWRRWEGQVADAGEY